VQAVEHKLLGTVRTQGKAQLDAASAQLGGGVPPDQVHTVTGAGPSFVQILDDQGTPIGVIGGSTFPVSGYAGQRVLGDGETGDTQVVVPSASGTGVPFDIRTTTVQTAAGQAFTVVVASPLDGVQRSINALKGSLLTALPFVVALVAIVAWFVVGRALQPVEAIRREVEAISADTMHRRVPEPRTSDEISRLAHTMNAMLDRLENSAAQQRQFVADASHELRSPIATIRAELEVALRSPARADWPRVAEGVLEEEGRLESLVADLLLLASVDEQDLPPDAAPVGLRALTSDEAARARRVAVTIAPGDEVFVSGRSDQLTRVIGNVFDNAARFGRDAIHVSITGDGDRARIAVDDDGPGIAPADRQRVFERFTRLDQSRARDNGGAGLGLALAKGIVERHRGTIHIEDSPLGGARVVVEIPALRQ
jgi:signal transduction histidine kinase